MWLNQYIGLPWVSGARGPDQFDCWGFVFHVQKEHYRHEFPLYPVNADNIRSVMHAFIVNKESKNWIVTDTPIDGDVVVMGQGRYHDHVGIWVNVDGGGVVHCVKGSGVIFSTLRDLRKTWPNFAFYRWVM